MEGRLPVVWHEAYEVDLGDHVFPTPKYRLVMERLLQEGTIKEEDVIKPGPAPDQAIARIHHSDYIAKIKNGTLSPLEVTLLEVPFSPSLRESAWIAAGGTILTGELALERGLAVHLGGGFHHAFPDHGEGFCLINDVAVAIAELKARGVVRRAAVIDCDLHQGNGTAAIFAKDPSVFTFSIHQENNYPARKPPSDLDVGLPDGAGDETYLAALRRHIPDILERHRPDLVFYLAGADPYREDQLGGLNLTMEGLRQRDLLVLEACRSRNLPVAVTLAGGYARKLSDTVEIHCNTVRAARELV
ncbi:Acetoin utilization protein AcuC [bacterium HR33]|nr:Acetoin utilization protein AcuC [bacterium HR33]